MDIADSLVAFMGAVIGGGITGYYTLKATDKAIRDQNDKELKREEKEVHNMLEALGVELEALWSFHMQRVGEKIEALPEGKPLEFYYPLTQDYFTIYNSNAAKIGAVKDPELRKAIVLCFNKCKKVVDGFKYNNDLFQQARTSGNSGDLAAYAKTLKEDHFILKGYVEQVLRLLHPR